MDRLKFNNERTTHAQNNTIMYILANLWEVKGVVRQH